MYQYHQISHRILNLYNKMCQAINKDFDRQKMTKIKRKIKKYKSLTLKPLNIS